MQKVSFTSMTDGSQEDFELIYSLVEQEKQYLSERVLAALEPLKTCFDCYQVTLYEHSLQAATRADRNGESEEMVVAALLHDIGCHLALYNHSEMAAAVLRPYVSEKTYWIIKHHSLFQKYYWRNYLGEKGYEREKYREHPYYQATVDFCENYDQNSFDPYYDSLPIDFFTPIVRQVFAQTNVKY